MNVQETQFPGLLVIDPVVHGDQRGFFLETYHRQRYRDAGLEADFVQDNQSSSRRGILRGLHYQLPNPQGKLIWVLAGEICDVAVDLRSSSPTFGKWFSIHLSSENHRQLYVPPGFAHGFCVCSDMAEVFYKCTDYRSPQAEQVLRWDDPELAIQWPVKDPILSQRDQHGLNFREALVYKGT